MSREKYVPAAFEKKICEMLTHNTAAYVLSQPIQTLKRSNFTDPSTLFKPPDDPPFCPPGFGDKFREAMVKKFPELGVTPAGASGESTNVLAEDMEVDPYE